MSTLESPPTAPVDEKSITHRRDIQWISASFILLLVISVGITSALLYIAARSQDRVAINDSTHLIKSVLSDIDIRLRDQLKDYSYWDEAVNNLVGETNAGWADNNIGIYMFETFGIAASFVIDTDNSTRYAMIDGQRSPIDSIKEYGPDLSNLIKQARSGLPNQEPIQVGNIVKSNGGIYLAAASVLSNFKSDNDSELKIRSNWVLIFMKAMDDTLLSEIADDYMLSNLHIEIIDELKDSRSSDASLPLKGVNGDVIAHLAWTPHSPSREMLNWLAPTVGVVFLLFAIITYVFLLKSKRITSILIDDINHISKEQEALRKGEERFHSLFRNLPIAVIEKDWSAAKKVIDELQPETLPEIREYFRYKTDLINEIAQQIPPMIFNAASMTIYHASSDQDFIDHLQSPFKNDDEHNAFCDTLSAFANGKYQITLYYWQVNCTGDEMYTRETVFIPKKHTDTWEHVIHATEDITELWQAEKATERALLVAENANMAKSQFLTTMSHELRTPLNAILGFSDVIRRQFFGEDNAQYQEYANDIYESGDHLLTLINDILDLSAIEAGARELKKEELSINLIVIDCSSIITNGAKNKNINFSSEIQKNIPKLFAHKRTVKQILINLLSNALKYTPGGGEITLNVSASNGQHIFNITDNGLGIAEDKIPMLTQPYARIQDTPYVIQEGTGLGLSIVSSLVKAHDGELIIESQHGKGTSVIVKLPSNPDHQ